MSEPDKKSKDLKKEYNSWYNSSILSDTFNHYYTKGFIHGATTVIVSGFLVYLCRR